MHLNSTAQLLWYRKKRHAHTKVDSNDGCKHKYIKIDSTRNRLDCDRLIHDRLTAVMNACTRSVPNHGSLYNTKLVKWKEFECDFGGGSMILHTSEISARH